MRTYVVRVQDARTSDTGPGSLRGVADEIATGRRVIFTSGTQLLDLLATPDVTVHADAVGRTEDHQEETTHEND